jgi:hypothetical protein
MQGLTLDDLLPLEEYASQRQELFAAHGRYLDRYRRVRLGPRLTLVFENRQTLWFRLHEILRVARLGEPRHIQHELDLYNRLLPARDTLQAALLLTVAEDAPFLEELAAWQEMSGTHLRFQVGSSYPADLITCRPEDRCIGAAHWVRFVLDQRGRSALGDMRQPANLVIALPTYHHDSGPLSEDIRQSLLDDLTLSDRDP